MIGFRDRSRRVPIADRVLPLIRACAEGCGPDERLFVTELGHRQHATAFKRTLSWAKMSEGRRIHDLRHTAACLWLARAVDVVTVRAWMGHASVATTNLYLHHLGTAADKAGLDRLNHPGHAVERAKRFAADQVALCPAMPIDGVAASRT